VNEISLPEKIQRISSALTKLPHAFGGALALAYYAEPRATQDIDLNVFLQVEHAEAVLLVLAEIGADLDSVAVRNGAQQALDDGQLRVFWGRTPVDLFFAYDPFHEAADQAKRVVPFADGQIQVLAPEHLIVCKVAFNRPKDWVDIDAIRTAGTRVEIAEVLRWVGRILGDDDPRFNRVAAVFAA